MAKLQITLRIDETVFGKLRVIAEGEGRTANNKIAHMVTQYVTDYEAEHGEIEADDNQD